MLNQPKPVLLLEFNELSPSLIDRFIDSGDLPHFEQLRERSVTFITEAGEESGQLNPWIQWVTVHTGVKAHEHGISQLGEASRLEFPTVADVVSESGRPVWLCGSMNVKPVGPVRGAFLPDPWSVGAQAQPSELQPFYEFTSANVQEHTNTARRQGKAEELAFLIFLVRHGLSPSTAASTVRQLVGERTGRTDRWRRAVVLDQFQWDVFRWYHKRISPWFSSFFSNSTAHLQHLYWRDMDPATFGLRPEPNSRYGDAILNGYRAMDHLVGRVLTWAGDDVTVVFCTALSQQANVMKDLGDYEGFHRPVDLDGFAASLGISGVVSTSRVMAEQFHLFFADDAAAAAGLERLRSASVDGQRAFGVRADGPAVFGGCRLFQPQRPGASLDISTSPRSLPLDSILYWVEAPRSGAHHPDGMLWIQTEGRVEGKPERVPLTSVAPTLLALLGLPRPASMRTEPLLEPSA